MRTAVLLVVAVAAAASLLGSAAGGMRAAAHQASTHTVKIVYAGSGKAANRWHRDFRPGHGGPEYDDTYTKNVSWEISWQVTITDGKITKVSTPVGSVTGRGDAALGSHPDESCGGLVALPKAQGERYVPINLQLVETTEQYITLKMTSFYSFGQMIPVYWADVPTCPSAVFTPIQTESSAGDKAIAAWFKSAEPVFKISLTNGYKITPTRFAHFWPFGPTAKTFSQKSFVYKWDSTITAVGQGSGSGPPPPPAKTKPCTPAPQRNAPADIQRYIHDFGMEAEKWINDVAAKEIPKDSPSEANETWEIYGVGCRNETAVLLGPPEMFVDPDDLYREKRAIPQGELGLIPPEFSATGGSPNVVIITGDSVPSGSSRAPSVVGSGSASGRVPRMTVRVTSAGVKALRTGKTFPVTLNATFKVTGKPPIHATTKIILRGPRPTPTITSVTFGGNVQSPSIVIHGQNLGTKPAPNPAGSPANRPLCPGAIKGDAGLDYGTSLYLDDTTANWAAGRYRPAANELDCIGLIVTKFTPTEVDYHFGGFYAQVYPKLALAVGDAVQVAVNGATKTVRVKYGATVTS